MKNRIHELKNSTSCGHPGIITAWQCNDKLCIDTLAVSENRVSAANGVVDHLSYAPLVCDTLEALCTVLVYILLETGLLCAWHLYSKCIERPNEHCSEPGKQCRNYFITPKRYYHKTSAMQSFSGSLITILHPMLASSLYAIGGMNPVIILVLSTFLAAFLALLLFVRIPSTEASASGEKETLFASVKAGLKFLIQTESL